MKLWQKDAADTTAALVESFTVGTDRDFDLLLAPYDVQGTAAHVQMLVDVGLMAADDGARVQEALRAIGDEIRSGTFRIGADVEDVHSQIELLLTERVGEAGKRVHTGRSRNDQVAVDIKLFLRDALLGLKDGVGALFEVLQALSERYKDVLMPGYTHLQVGMPSSFGLWLGAYAECLVEDLEVVAAAYAVVDKNPLGSGAGYGSSFPLDRARTTELLGFRTMHYNSLAAQMSRGRSEKLVAMGLSTVASTLARLAMDICLYTGQNFGFLSFPDALTTGSSIMPHKKNPDPFELVRGRCNRLQSLPNELALLLTNLPGGYHRDLQLTKEILFPGLATLRDCIELLVFALPQMQVCETILDDPKYRYLYSVERVNELVQQGIPFRDAYRQVGQAIEAGQFSHDAFRMETHRHAGSIGMLCTDAVREEWQRVAAKFR